MSLTNRSELDSLDVATRGVFSATSSVDRATRLQAWLDSQPDLELMQSVFRELSARDKGASKALRERIEDIKRAQQQTELVALWEQKGQALLQNPKMPMAQALAWQRDAAKAGAPLSCQPLADIKRAINARFEHIEDLQHQAQVLRESAVLLGQRTEVMSTRLLTEAQAQLPILDLDMTRWQQQCSDLMRDPDWPSVDLKYQPALQTSAQQLQAVFGAFGAALSQSLAAANDASLPLPEISAWADQIRQQRSQAASQNSNATAASSKSKIDPASRLQAAAAVQPILDTLEQELSQGHGKASAEAANNLRTALRLHARHLPESLEHQAQAALHAASELEGWQRWRANQLRVELVARAEGLFKPAPPETPGQPTPEPQPIYGGRRLQETLRELREQWKQTDLGGLPNHALWRRFDQACNRAHKVVEVWLDKIHAESRLHQEQRLHLISELNAWASENAQGPDWRTVARELQQFDIRWHQSGKVMGKASDELQAQWHKSFHAASAPLDAEHQAASERRKALIQQAVDLAQQPGLPLDAIKTLQQRWQTESQSFTLDRRVEQKLWEAFRAPIDGIFQRKSQERDQMTAELGSLDRAVIEAAKALDAACKTNDAGAIRMATQALQNATRGAQETVAPSDAAASDSNQAPASTSAPEAPMRKLVAVRGDDRPGMKKTEPAVASLPRGPRHGAAGRQAPATRNKTATEPNTRGPRLGESAFRAMRQAQDLAEQTLRKLSAQAQGEVLVQLLQAWKDRQPDQLPAAKQLGAKVNAVQRQAWVNALSHPAVGPESGEQVILRLEIAADVPSPAQHLSERRLLQLTLLTQRKEASPSETWVADLAQIFGWAYTAETAHRLQNALTKFLR